LEASWERLKQLNFGLFALALVVGLPEFLFKSLRLCAFMKKAKSRLSFKEGLTVFFSGQPLAAVTPGKLGDVIRIILLSRFGKISKTKALAVHAADRIYDLVAIVFLALIGILSYISNISPAGSAVSTLLGLLCGMALILILLNPRWIKFILKPLLSNLLSKKLADDIAHHGQEFNSELKPLLTPSFKLFGPFTLSILAWQTTIVRDYFLALSIGLSIPLLKLVLLIPVMIMVELLPISIMGFGPREKALFVLFASSTVHPEDLLVFSILMAASTLLPALIGIPAAAQMIPQGTKSNETP
jgi:uncharacterized protein (TIRG00374 family)